MSDVREASMEGSGPCSGAASGEREVSRKEQVVLRLLRGESLDLLARETGQPAGRIAGWREEFQPETNGCAEKAIQTLKQQPLWIERVDTLDELRTGVRTFGRTYNQH